MRVTLVVLLLLAFVSSTAIVPGIASDKPSIPVRPVHTFSIVARDPDTGELGVAVQSHWFSVGPIVPWVEAGVGAIATQSFVDPSYGKNGLELMRAGKSAPDTLKELLAKDEGREVRDGDVVPACVKTCQTKAMYFGNIADPESEVSRLSKSNRATRLLEDLGTKPRVIYLNKGD